MTTIENKELKYQITIREDGQISFNWDPMRELYPMSTRELSQERIKTMENALNGIIGLFVHSPDQPVYGTALFDFLNETSGGEFKMVSQSIEEQDEDLIF